MTLCDYEYKKLVRRIMESGLPVHTRNANVRRVFPHTVEFSSTPLVTVRRTAWKNSLREWEWFMSGSNNINDLHASVRPWWQPWADRDGVVAMNYGVQFREFTGGYSSEMPKVVDQIDYLLESIRDHPGSRRAVITTWNTADMIHPDCKITNCHGTVIQAFVGQSGFVQDPNALHLVTYQRSVDVIVGLPHNWFQYWCFLLWLAHRTRRSAGTLTWIGGDCHVYEEHFGLAGEIYRTKLSTDRTPEVYYSPNSEEFKADDFKLDGDYKPLIDKPVKMIV